MKTFNIIDLKHVSCFFYKLFFIDFYTAANIVD